MSSPFMKRLQVLERKLDPPANKQIFVVIDTWSGDSEEEHESKLARWRAGEDIEGAPTDIEDRENATIWIVQFGKPGDANSTTKSRGLGGTLDVGQ